MNNKTTYLLVEDDETQACLLSKWLRQVAKPVEIAVIIADNLADGLAFSQKEHPNATFLDLLIPLTKGGPTVTMEGAGWKSVADHIDGFVPPVIVTTGMDVTEEIRLYCMTTKGAHNVLHKPFDDSFFSRLKTDSKLFAAQLLAEAGAAQMRAAHSNHNGRTQ